MSAENLPAHPSNEQTEERLTRFIPQIKASVQQKAPGVYLVMVADVFLPDTQSYQNETGMATIDFIKESDISHEEDIEEDIARMYNCDSIIAHLQSRNERTHSIIFSYGVKNAAGEYLFSLSGPL